MAEESTRERRGRRMREQILATAREIVLESGVDGLTLREVARRLDYSPGALYTYFPDKDALLDALTAGVFEELGRYFERVPRGSPRRRAAGGLGRAYLDFATENPEQYLLVFTRIAAPATTRFDEREATPYPWSIVVEACQAGVEAGRAGHRRGLRRARDLLPLLRPAPRARDAAPDAHACPARRGLRSDRRRRPRRLRAQSHQRWPKGEVMNFTVEQFLSVFEKYNQAVWPMQIVAYALGIVLVALALTKWKRASAVIFGALAVMWAGMAVGYMWLYFADINKAAYLFGVIFLAQAVLLALAAVRERNVSYGRGRDARMWVGLALIVYAMVAYPLLGMALGHSYPRAPMFGLVPCPTTIFTFGMLLLAARPKRLLLWLPLVWSVIGFFAAVKFGIREDIGLLLAGSRHRRHPAPDQAGRGRRDASPRRRRRRPRSLLPAATAEAGAAAARPTIQRRSSDLPERVSGSP